MLGLTIACAFACGGDDDMGQPNGAAGATSAGGDPTALCNEWCDHQVAAGCANTPAGYATACKALCAATTQATPEPCRDELSVQQACSARLQFQCDTSGIARPVGNCARESAACAQCAGKLCSSLL